MAHPGPRYHHRSNSKSKEWRKFIDTTTYLIAIFGPIAGLPQLYKVWITKDVTGVSAISWAAFTMIWIVWLMHAIIYKDRPLKINSIAWIILTSLIAIGALTYG